MDKEALRNKYRAKREALTTDTLEEMSLAIANRCLRLPIWDQTNYHIFLSMSAKKEVDTSYLLHILQGRDKTIAVPKTQFKEGSMLAILLQENTKLRVTPMGVPEPEDGIVLPPNVIEVVFVPLLAFDTTGHRLGYGKGFYDRFLAQCSSGCRFIGLSFFPPENQLPSNSLDIPLHYCVTPDSIYQF